MKKHRRALGWSAIALLVGALAFLAAGCGGGGESSSGTTSETSNLPAAT